MSADEAFDEAFEAMAVAHPHEVYATYPDRFWALFQRLRPGMDRETMESMLAATEVQA